MLETIFSGRLLVLRFFATGRAVLLSDMAIKSYVSSVAATESIGAAPALAELTHMARNLWRQRRV